MTTLYNTLGRTGLTVSAMGLGGASIGGSYGPVDEPEALRTVQRALELGVTFIDTAPLYGMGHSEERIGRALAESGARTRVVLATKVGYIPPGLAYDRDTTVKAVEASLRRLQTDYIDLIQIHEVDRVLLNQAVAETLEGFRLLQAAGKVRFTGITGYALDKMTEAVETGLFDTVQTFAQYTPANQDAARRLLPAAVRLNMGVINGSPLGMGLLTGAPHIMTRPPSPEQRSQAERVAALAARLGMSVPELAIRFSLSQPAISVTIPGTKNVARLEQNVAAWQAGPLPQAVLDEILQLS